MNTKVMCYFGVIAFLVLAIVADFLHSSDQVWLLDAAKLWLSGKKLYVDIIETNPPLIVWIYAIAVKLSVFMGISDTNALVSFGLLVISLSIAVTARVVSYHPAFSSTAEKLFHFILLMGLVSVFFESPLYYFDREHVSFTLFLPYIIRWMPSLAKVRLPLPLRMTIGFMAGVGFCIKPHCAVIFLGVQLISVFQQRSFNILRSVENCIIYAVAGLYSILIWHYAHEYFSVLLPMLLLTYGAFSYRLHGALIHLPGIVFMTGIVLVDFRTRHTTPYRRDIHYFLLMSFAFLIYALLNNGWPPTYQPLYKFVLFTIGWIFWDYRHLKLENACDLHNTRQFTQGMYACIFVFVLNIGVVLIKDIGFIHSRLNSPVDAPLMLKLMHDNNAKTYGNMTITFGLIL